MSAAGSSLTALRMIRMLELDIQFVRLKVMKVHRFGILFIAVMVGVFFWSGGAGLLQAQETKGEAKVAPGLEKVVKLVESGVGEEVVLAYVRNSPVPKPNADEIIHLHQSGVPSVVITALLSKNGTANASAASEPVTSGRILTKPVYEQPASAPASVVYVERAPSYVQPQPTVVYVPSSTPQYYPYSYYPGYHSSPGISLGFDFGHHGFGLGHHLFGHHLGGHLFSGHHGSHAFGHGGHHGGGHHGGGHHSGHGGPFH